ncbi:MAG: lasso peptide biosynthesis PqqD family chaperone [Clostridia bacterium]|nr:lasso peptide biosynthesis PqqD family chaperone [Clostridia bacterium]
MQAVNEIITLETSVERKDGLVTTDLGGEIGMMHIERGMYYSFDPVGTRIWELIEESKNVEDIICSLLKEYEVEERVCQEQVLEFLTMLYKNDLININKTR